MYTVGAYCTDIQKAALAVDVTFNKGVKTGFHDRRQHSVFNDKILKCENSRSNGTDCIERIIRACSFSNHMCILQWRHGTSTGRTKEWSFAPSLPKFLAVGNCPEKTSYCKVSKYVSKCVNI